MAQPSLTKSEIVNRLVTRFDLSTYLELATPGTGKHYSDIDQSILKQWFRMMYITPEVYDDGMKVDFRSPDESINRVLHDLRQCGAQVDVCLVDGFHTYHTASRDIREMFELIEIGGFLVVHDCLPTDRHMASPGHHAGAWCGVHYKAYLDFVLRHDELDYFTVDCDYGCGVIAKKNTFEALLAPKTASSWQPGPPDDTLIDRFLSVGTDYPLAYDIFEANHAALLRLIKPETFLEVFQGQPD